MSRTTHQVQSGGLLISLAGSLLAEISLAKLIAAWAILILLPALSARSGTVACLDLDQRGLVEGRFDLHRTVAPSSVGHPHSRGLVWRQTAVAPHRDELLVVECACRSACIRAVARGITPTHRAVLACPRRPAIARSDTRDQRRRVWPAYLWVLAVGYRARMAEPRVGPVRCPILRRRLCSRTPRFAIAS